MYRISNDSFRAITVTYTSVYTDSEPGRVFWGDDEELSDEGSPRVIVYGNDGPPIQPVAPSPDYVPGLEHPSSPDYDSLPFDASPVALSAGYVADSDPEEDHVDYPADGGDDDDEPSDDDDDDTDDEETSTFEMFESIVSQSTTSITDITTSTSSYIYHQFVPHHYHYHSLTTTPLLASLCIPPPVDRREDSLEAELPPRKRLCLTALISRRQRAEEVGYGIRDVWVDPTEAVEEVAPTTLEGVNPRVTEPAAVQEQDTQDIYAFHYETARLLDQEALVSREAWAHSVGLRVTDDDIDCTCFITTGTDVSDLGQIQALQARDQTHADDREGAASTAVGLVFSFLISDNHNNMPPRRSSATARAATAAAAPMTADVVEQLIEARVSTTLANHETL
ncbi:hypothetical protein Tco_0699320 [Tanacetum coccineum]